ncbi:MAG: TIGR03620 family F420-dependent LLM class oxidoreductase [Solirubrobacteraceae bacterium]|nr:TIGR03620 family F420-dependent LLM class oxidoreductase [Solirubrobacteraceae bacterium]
MAVDLGRVGVWSNRLRYHEDRAAVADAAAELDELGYGALWLPDVGGDVIGDVEHVLDATRRCAVATGILNIWMHEAEAVAAGTARLAQRRPGRFLLGLGASHVSVVDAQEPGRYARPYSAMVAYLDALDAATPPVAPGDRILAALRPRMLELSRDRAAGAHPYLVPVEHTRRARELLGPGPLLAPEVGVLLDPDDGPARAREHVADYLRLPNYVRHLRHLGYGDEDLTGTPSERLARDLVAWGDEAAIAARVREHLDAGADHVCVQVLGTAEPLPRAAWRRLAAALL